MDAVDRARFESLRVERDQHLMGASRAVLAALLADRWGIVESVVHRRGERPKLAAGGPWLSLAHAGGVVAAGVADAPVGVDVETVPPPDTGVEYLERALTPWERRRARLSRQPEADRVRLWARKEALMKATGRPDLAAMGRTPAAWPLRRNGTLRPWRIRDLEAGPGHLGALAVVIGTRVSIEYPVSLRHGDGDAREVGWR